MAEQILMTALSPTMDEGTLVAWKKKEGDTVNSGDVLCEVETDKATMDYESTQEGVLLKIVLPEGKSATVGQVIAIIGEKGEDYDDLMPSAASGTKAESASKSDEKASDDKADQKKDTSSNGKDAAKDANSEAKKPDSGSGGTSSGAAATGSTDGFVKASPLARKIAQMKNIDLSQVSGSGPDGRVVKRDVEEFQPQAAAASGRAASQPAGDQKISVSGRRAVIAKRLAESKFQAPHYYVKTSVNMEQVIAARTALNRELPQKAGFNAFIVKFVAEALKRHPVINSSWQGDHILQFGSIDIGLAVDAGNGLITPIIRNCGNRGVTDIDNELKVLIEKAQNNALKPEEYTGATFTISNLGSFGIEEFTAIINPPGAAILAVGETVKTPVVNDADEVVVKPMMKLSLSSDHRVIDGAAAARFMHELKLMMENPARVLF
ncbi:MAG: pyruvate dehydrogenase complex dihydrolipoamide acetyltransferase [Spirochaetaceae bacterium]|nr:MAG: pyruvate dehydrogenase complex dihydrolipoamide acetyltransferase [Spirochaetaceae bacterium]